MKKPIGNIDKENKDLDFHPFNKENEKNPSTKHQSLLGLDVPEEYFQHSKNDILDKLTEKKKKRIFGLNPIFAYPIAASLIFLLGLSIWLQFSDKTTERQTSYATVSDSAILIESLLVDDEKMNSYLDNYILDEILVEAEISEQKIENIFINSLFIEDSMMDDYFSEKYIDALLL